MRYREGWKFRYVRETEKGEDDVVVHDSGAYAMCFRPQQRFK